MRRFLFLTIIGILFPVMAVFADEQQENRQREYQQDAAAGYEGGEQSADATVDGSAVDAEQQTDGMAGDGQADGEIETEVPGFPEITVSQDFVKPPPEFFAKRPEDYYNVFVGDSRTVALYRRTRGVECCSAFICEEGVGYSWLTSEKVQSRIREFASAERNLNLIINLGINDTDSLAAYATYLNKKAPQWRELGYKLYYVSVNPVGEEYSIRTNAMVDEFNFELENSLADFSWLDCNAYLKSSGYVTTDSLHYDPETTDKIYDFIVMNVD